MIDALFLSRITFSFLEATSVYYASDAVTMVAYVGYCVGSGTGGGGGGLLCANFKPSTLRYSTLEKPAHPTERPTGTIKQLFFIYFRLRIVPFEPQQSSRSNQQNIFVLFDASIIVYYYFNTFLTMYYIQCLLFCYVLWLCTAINISVQHNGGILPDIMLLTQGQRVPRTVLFPWRIVQSI